MEVNGRLKGTVNNPLFWFSYLNHANEILLTPFVHVFLILMSMDQPELVHILQDGAIHVG